MITAIEAKALYAASGAEADALVAKMEEPIRKACAAGNSWVFIFVDAMENRALPTQAALAKAKTAIHDQAMVKLKELGFSVRFCTYGDTYVPCGLADDEGNGPSYVNYGFMVGW